MSLDLESAVIDQRNDSVRKPLGATNDVRRMGQGEVRRREGRSDPTRRGGLVVFRARVNDVGTVRVLMTQGLDVPNVLEPLQVRFDRLAIAHLRSGECLLGSRSTTIWESDYISSWSFVQLSLSKFALGERHCVKSTLAYRNNVRLHQVTVLTLITFSDFYKYSPIYLCTIAQFRYNVQDCTAYRVQREVTRYRAVHYGRS